MSLLNFIQMDSRSVYPFYPGSLVLPIGVGFLYSYILPTLCVITYLPFPLFRDPELVPAFCHCRRRGGECPPVYVGWSRQAHGSADRTGCKSSLLEIMLNYSPRSLCPFYVPASSSLRFTSSSVLAFATFALFLLISGEWCVIVVVFCLLLISNEIEHRFTCLSAFWASTLLWSACLLFRSLFSVTWRSSSIFFSLPLIS